MRHSIGADQFRQTMGQLASGVTVVTVRDAAGHAWGMTVSAVTSLSLVPPMLLVCIDRAAAIHDMITGVEWFGINVLEENQAEVARRFAHRDKHSYDEHRGDHSPGGLPLVPGAVAYVDVLRTAVHQGGDHSIIVGDVAWSAVREGRPLCYFRSTYTGLAP